MSLAVAAPLFAIAADAGPAPQLSRHGPAPDFVGIDTWLNSPPLSIAALRGQVLLVDFWTYGCINCVHVLPHLVEWHAKYKDRGLTVVGVHMPEFAFERDTSNVKQALQRHGIRYPIAQDNKFATWNAYRNRYWPTAYLIDRSGELVFQHAGEGAYAETERTIELLLG